MDTDAAADPQPSPDAAGDRHPGMPRWVKAAIALTVVIVAAIVISMLAGAEHGPGMHGGSSGQPVPAVHAAALVLAGGHDAPA